jgi:hypothetical protein
MSVQGHSLWTPGVMEFGGQLGGQMWDLVLASTAESYADDQARPACDDKARKAVLLVLI